MKKLYALLFMVTFLAAFSVKAQTLYTNTIQTGFRFNPGLGTAGTPIIVFDDINIPSSVVGDADSIGFTKIKVGIRRLASAPAVTVNVYLTGADPIYPTLTFLDSFPAVPPTLIGTFNLPANGAASVTQILSIGDSINVLKAIARDTGNLATGFQTVFLGVSFSAVDANSTNGWRLTSGPDTNFDVFWSNDVDDAAAPRTAGALTGAVSTFYAETFGRPIYAPLANDVRVADLFVPQEVTCFDGGQNVTVQLQNTGTNPIAAGAATVKLEVTGANTSTTTLTNPAVIAPGALVDISFPSVLINSAGFNDFTASVAMAADGRPTNDTLLSSNFTAPVLNTFPLVDDAEIPFEPVITWWESIAGGNAWGYSIADTGLVLPNRTFVDTLRAHSGTGFYFFDGFNAPAGVESRLFTNCVQLGAAASGGGACTSTLSFWSSLDSSWADFGDDSLYISVSTDKGATWTRLTGFSTLDLSVGNAVWAQNIVDLSAYNGQTIQIGFEGVSGFRQRFGVDDVEIFSDCVLPVTLSKFFVQKQNKANRVSWTTSQEINSLKFEIQQSRNGRDFVTLGEVAAAGNSNTERTYSFTHNLPLTGYNYYRIKMIDRDNKSKYSPVRSVQNLGINQIQVTPNPVTSNMKVSINAANADVATIMITDMSGKVISNKNYPVAAGDNNIPVSTASLTAGSYIVKVQLNGDVQVSKFIKL